jgi:hypothetical protein
VVLLGALTFVAAPASAHGDATGTDGDGPTCSATLGIEVHGQHIVGDYVIGGGTSWPPSHGVVGDAVGGAGAEVPGGPGPGFHFPNGFAPGASFCNGSSSPGIHL